MGNGYVGVWCQMRPRSSRRAQYTTAIVINTHTQAHQRGRKHSRLIVMRVARCGGARELGSAAKMQIGWAETQSP